MRYLNKIVFINSAKIPYAEIQLDGNIHFIGTQGVGKSTLLRAILYFYNADSRNLGMPKGPTVKNFADWYFSYTNSFIVYEVLRETGAYCVFAFKSQNRVCFRFIDSAYKREYFIQENGESYSGWNDIRAQLDANRINVSTLIKGSEQYRDILYGNHTGTKEFKKYALLETKLYNNIYRTIQNVFLNTKLDANEIKQTIISSMEDEQISIDLEQYHHHLKDFEPTLEDIRKFRLPSVQNHATKSIEILSQIRHDNREQEKLIGQLLFRLKSNENEKPKLQEQEYIEKNELASKQQKLDNLGAAFNKKQILLNGEISAEKENLRKSVKRKKNYQIQNINEIISQVENEKIKKTEHAFLNTERTLLTSKFSDINARYDAQIKQFENKQKESGNLFEQQKNEVKASEVEFSQNLNLEYDSYFKKLDQDHESESEAKQQLLDQKNAAVSSKKNEHKIIQQKTFYKTKLEQLKQEISETKISIRTQKQDTLNYQQEIKLLSKQWEFDKRNAEKENSDKKEKLNKQLNKQLDLKTELVNKIEKSKDSFYSWLNETQPDWKNNIGKLIDEELLFMSDLSPQKIDDGKSLFGIQLNLTKIESKVKSIDDYNFELQNTEGEIETSKKEIRNMATLLEKEIDKLQRHHLPKIKELKEKARQSEYNSSQLQYNLEKIQLDENELAEKAIIEKQKALSNNLEEIDKVVSEKKEAENDLKKTKEKVKKSKDQKQKEKARRITQEKKETESKIKQFNLQLKEQKEEIAEKTEKIITQRNQELNHQGIETERLSEIEKQIVLLENELVFIDKNKQLVYDYYKDKRELFDQEKNFKNKISIAQEHLKKEDEEFKALRIQLLGQIREINTRIQQTKDLLQTFEKDAKKFETFKTASSYSALQEKFSNSKPLYNKSTAIEIIDSISETYYSTLRKQGELRESINNFLGKFSDGNIFNFPKGLLKETECMHWASEVNDFIEENKIAEYEKRTNERFADIVKLVGNETTLLISKTGEIKKIINKINTDFRQKNFVAAVTNIELDIRDSSNSAVLLLQKIKEFNDQNSFVLGEPNLFSIVHDQQKTNLNAVNLLKQLVKEINTAKNTVVQLADSFELSFRVEENGNNTGWVEKLTNVGSEGTDVLVKAMINIMLLNVFKEGASKKFKDFKLHCMMDEIGKLHPNNVKGILKFANDRNILLINGSPTESTPLNYRHIYKISKNVEKDSIVKRIVSNPA